MAHWKKKTLAARAMKQTADDDIISVGDGNVGPVAQRLFDSIQGIQYGSIEDPMGWIEPVC